MVWLQTEDALFYFSKEELDIRLKELKVYVDTQNLQRVLSKDTKISIDDKDSVYISPFLPSELNYSDAFFCVIELGNKFGLLTSEEKKAGITEEDKLNEKLKFKIEKSTITFEDTSTDEKLIFIKDMMMLKYSLGEYPKAVFLVGYPGLGKSLFAQSLAGSTDRYLVSFNLANLMYEKNPPLLFDQIIEFLQSKKDMKYLLWLDEIDKIFTGSETSQHIKNKLLTFLNDLGLTIELDAFVVITANNVTDILKTNPEMVRSGRVEPYAKVFMDFLSLESAKKSTAFYIQKRNSTTEQVLKTIIESKKSRETPHFVKWMKDVIHKYKTLSEIPSDEKNMLLSNMKIEISAEDIVDYIDKMFVRVMGFENGDDKFPYVHAEINHIVSQIFYANLEEKITKENYTEVIAKIMRTNIPIKNAGKEGIDAMRGNKDKFSVFVS